jgi:trans-aconitate 2-methyltransferase
VSQPEYLFGDSDAAAQRLKLLAGIYQESTGAFLSKAASSNRFPLVLDLGCGSGLTTRLIADRLRCNHVIGLDASTGFIELARAHASHRVSFFRHDVTAVPFPSGSANLIFSRFLLTHLRDAPTAVSRWATQLKDRGLLLLEETEAIDTDHPVFAPYLSIVERLLANHSNQLYAGHLVASLDSPGGLKSIFNELRSVPVRNCEAAKMFVLNLRTWKENEFIRDKYSSESILELDEALTQIGNDDSSARDIEWKIRQAAWLKD